METKILETAPYPASVAVEVDGYTVLNRRSSWWVKESRQLWEEAVEGNPVQEDERVYSGCIPSANYSGTFTLAQSQAFKAKVNALIKEGKKATKHLRKRKARASRPVVRSSDFYMKVGV